MTVLRQKLFLVFSSAEESSLSIRKMCVSLYYEDIPDLKAPKIPKYRVSFCFLFVFRARSVQSREQHLRSEACFMSLVRFRSQCFRQDDNQRCLRSREADSSVDSSQFSFSCPMMCIRMYVSMCVCVCFDVCRQVCLES